MFNGQWISDDYFRCDSSVIARPARQWYQAPKFSILDLFSNNIRLKLGHQQSFRLQIIAFRLPLSGWRLVNPLQRPVVRSGNSANLHFNSVSVDSLHVFCSKWILLKSKKKKKISIDKSNGEMSAIVRVHAAKNVQFGAIFCVSLVLTVTRSTTEAIVDGAGFFAGQDKGNWFLISSIWIRVYRDGERGFTLEVSRGSKTSGGPRLKGFAPRCHLRISQCPPEFSPRRNQIAAIHKTVPLALNWIH